MYMFEEMGLFNPLDVIRGLSLVSRPDL